MVPIGERSKQLNPAGAIIAYSSMTMPILWLRGQNWYRRRASKWLGRRAYTIRPGRPIVSFTFDDFPRSALIAGRAILAEHGCRGSYYVSLGLAGKIAASGEMFNTHDLPHLFAAGHEIGCHTFHHCPAWETKTAAFEQSVVRNAQALDEIIPGAQFRTLSYPISCPRPATKRVVASRFECCRGGGQTFNTGAIDLNNVASFFIEQCHGSVSTIEHVVHANAEAGGWLVFSTHDISTQPTRFGCTPSFFRLVLEYALRSGAAILPMAEALDELVSRPLGRW